jgi:S-DNA-T family DNA segregation ATPase FtsK/SpoIIIE
MEGEAKSKQLAAALKPFGIGTEQIGRRIGGRAVTRRGIVRDHILAAMTEREKNRPGN